MLILNKTRINILVDVHFLIPTFQVVLIHINKVGNRINKVGHETTKWVNESTKWVNESTSWTAPNQPRGSRQLYALEWAFQSSWPSSWTRRRVGAFPSSSTREAERDGQAVFGLSSPSTGSPSPASAPPVPSCPTWCSRWTTSARSCPSPWTGAAWPGRTGTSPTCCGTTLGRPRGKHWQKCFSENSRSLSWLV